MNRNRYLKIYGVFLLFLSILLILLIYSIISVAQTQENTWAKIYGSLKYDTATSVIKTSDGNYLIGGVTDRGAGQRFGFGSLFVLLKIEPSGRIVWCKKYGDRGAIRNSHPDPNNEGRCGQPKPGKVEPEEIIETKDCGYAVIAYSCLLRLDRNGNILWAKKYDCITKFTSIQELDDGGFITCGNTNTIITGYATLAIIRLDKEGNILWSKAYEGEEIVSHYDHYFKIRVLRNGDFILGGHDKGVHYDMEIIKLDFQGKVKWSKIYKSASASLYSSFGFYSFCITKNEEIIASMHCGWRPQHTGQGSIIVKLNTDGHVMWSKCIISPYHGYDFYIQDACCLENGEIVLVGSATPIIVSAMRNLNTLALKMEQNGSIKWMKIQGVDKSRYNCDYVTSVTESDNAGLLYVGASNSFSEPHSFDFFVVKMGENGGVSKGGYFLRDIDFNDDKKVKISSPQIETQNIYIQTIDGKCSFQDVEFLVNDEDFSEKTIPKPKLKLAFSDRGRTLTSNLPIFIKEDEVGNTKIDSDGDGIVQEWEDMAMDYINPYIELDKKEPWLTRQDTDHVANFVRVHPYPDFYYVPDSSYHLENLPQYVIFRYLVTWSKDYGRQSIGDYDIDIFTRHSGDHERIFMAWKVIDNKTLRLEWVFTSSHKDPDVHHAVWNALHRTCNKGDVAYWPPTEFYHTEVFCGKLKFSQNNRLIIYASEGKHALYPSCDICENVMLVDLLGPVNIGEDCGGGGRFRFHCYNVGEPGGWTIQDKDVYDLTVEEEYLDKGKLGGPLPNIFENKLTCRYRIQIKTGNKKLAGTDAKLSIKLFGSKGISQWFEVYTEPAPPRYGSADRIGTFEKGDTDNIYINSIDLGELDKIQIKHNNSGDVPGWYISDIWVEDLETNKIWNCQANIWLDKVLFDNTDKTFDLDS